MLFLDVGRLDVDALAKVNVTVKQILRRQVRALEAIARILAEKAEAEAAGGSDGADSAKGAPPSARGYLFVIDVRDGTAKRFLSGWRLWADIAGYEAKYYPCLLSSVCVVRAPSIGQWALGMCKRSFLDKGTAEKIFLDAADDPAGGVLATLLPPDLIAQLPRELVGDARRSPSSTLAER